MAFTRSFLKATGLNDEQISSIMEEHVAVVDGLKKERDAYARKAEESDGRESISQHRGTEGIPA